MFSQKSISNTNINIFTDEEILKQCHHLSPKHVLDESEEGTVLQISADLIVKVGPHVHVEEFNNQKAAYNLIDQSIVRVPKAYRFFSRNIKTNGRILPTGFIVMEFVEGSNEVEVPSEKQMLKLSNALAHFNTITSPIFTSLGGDPGQGRFWEANGCSTCATIELLEGYLNSNLDENQEKLDLKNQKLVLCHLDLAPRNVFWLKNGDVCFIDWESAGFYPRFFEVAVLEHFRQYLQEQDGEDRRFMQRLGAKIILSLDEQQQLLRLVRYVINFPRE